MTNLSIDDYVLQLLEELNSEDLSAENVDAVIKKIDATAKIATVSIEKQKADAQVMEAENRKLEIETKRGLIVAQITGKVPTSFKDDEVKMLEVRDANK